MKRTLSLILVISMLLSMFCVMPTNAATAEEPSAPAAQSTNYVLGKVADGLDANYQTNVTLTVGGDDINLGTDIIYIVGSYATNDDGSPNIEGDVLLSSLVDTMTEIVAMGVPVNFGMIPFSSDNVLAMPLTTITEDNLAQLPAMIANALATCEALYDGVNMENALIKAKKMFSESTLKDHPERQHLVMIGSGFTYFFNSGENNEYVSTVPVNYKGVNRLFYWNKAWQRARTNQTNTYPIPKGIVNAYNTYKTENPNSTTTLWDFYWSYIDTWARADIAAGDKVVYEACTVESGNFLTWYSSGETVKGYSRTGYGNAVPAADASGAELANTYVTLTAGANPLTDSAAAHAIGYERAMWEAYEYIKANITGGGINFYPIYNALNKYYTNGNWSPANWGVSWTNQYIGHSFIDMLAGGEGKAVKYDTQGDKTFFDPIKESILYAVSSGSSIEDFLNYDGTNNFDFVEDASLITLKVGDTTYTTVMTSDTAEGSSYAFYAPGATEPTFTLDYSYGNGKDTEKYVLTINESISFYAPLALTYKATLVERSTVPSDEPYVVDVSVATLDPRNSAGEDGQDEPFPIPTVSYIVPFPTYTVTYVWSGLPAAHTETLPVDNNEYRAGAAVNVDTTYANGTTVKIGHDYYTFSGWDRGNFQMPAENVTIVGTWTKTGEDPQFNVTYEWTGLPENNSEILPVDSNKYYEGDAVSVDTKYTSSTTVKVGHDYYTFSGWDKADFNMPGENVTIRGTWTKTGEDPQFKVTYVWSGLPEGNVEVLPTDQNKYYEGDAVTVDTKYTSSTTVKIGHDYYTFSGWDRSNFNMPGNDVIISGTWTKTGEDPQFNVTYVWTGLPENNVEVLPTDSNKYYEGDAVSVDTKYTSSTTVKIGHDYYTFSGWDRSNFNMPAENVTIRGTWTKTGEDPQFNVTYVWTGLPAENVEILPTDAKLYYEGDAVTVDANYANGTSVKIGHDYYTFSGWDRSNFNMPAENVTIEGEWTKTGSDPQFKVTYEWTGLPAENDEVLPTDAKLYYAGDAVTVDTKYTSSTTVKIGHDYYEFSGWNKADFAMPDHDVTIVGVWTKSGSDPQFKVTYEWTGLPATATEVLPTDAKLYYAGDAVTVDASYANGTTVKVGHDYYTFSGWDRGNFNMPAENVTIKGEWTKSDSDPQFKVTYVWSGLPAENVEVLPTDAKLYYEGDAVTVDTKYISSTTVKIGHDYYTFSGWDRGNFNMPAENVTIVGTWTKSSSDPQFNVTYVWSGLPEGNVEVLPTDSNKYFEGDAVTVDANYANGTSVKIGYDYYTFSGWNKADFNMPNHDVIIVGTWIKTGSDPQFKVTYTWSGLPANADATLPIDTNLYYAGTPVTVDSIHYQGMTVKVGHDYYTFSGWDRGNFNMPAENVTIVGIWTKSSSDPTFNVTYVWSGLPAGAAVIPTDINSYFEGDSVIVNSTFITGTTVKVGHDYYTFSGWDRSNFQMPAQNVVIAGNWTKSDSDPQFNVTYSWTGLPAEANANLPAGGTYYAGDYVTVDTKYTQGTEIKIGKATYTFSGWDKGNFQMPAEDVEIFGVWTKTTTPAKATIRGTKYLDGKLASGFTFALEDDNGNVLDYAESVNGSFKFTVEIEDEGIYYFTISELSGSDASIDYDTNEFEVKITVKEHVDGLKATVSIVGASKIAFYNYTIPETTEPEPETTEPEPETTEPETTEPEPETTEPEPETTEPEPETTEPEPETTEPEPETTEPEPETTEPEPETTEPEPEITVPEETTEPEEELTEDPVPLDPAPETGDNAIVITIAILAIISLGVIYFKRRKIIED